MKKSFVTKACGKSWALAGGFAIALLMANVNPAAAQSDAAKAAILTLRATVPARVVQFAAGAASKKLRIGGPNGQCTDLVIAALASAGAKPGDFSNPTNYVWGTLKLTTRLRPGAPAMGDIIQFEGCYFEAPGKTQTFTMEHHTAIVESNKGGVLTVLHQNGPGGGETRRDTLDMSWLKRGRYMVYAPIPK
jgi:hypothetical protein